MSPSITSRMLFDEVLKKSPSDLSLQPGTTSRITHPALFFGQWFALVASASVAPTRPHW